MSTRPSRPEVIAFLDAIKEAPADDIPRLILADWLEENGDAADAGRAELLRLQCRLVRIDRHHRQWEELEQREADLINRYRDTWLGPLRPMLLGWAFQRGLVSVVVELDSLLAEAEAATSWLETWAWVDTVTLRGVPENLSELAWASLLQRVTSLSLETNRIGSRGTRVLVASPYLGKLTELYLGGNQIGDEGVRALAASPYLARLTVLGLSNNRIGDEGGEALAFSPYLGLLTTLNLGANQIGDDGVKALVGAAPLSVLTSLSLWSNRFGDAAARDLVRRFGDAVRL